MYAEQARYILVLEGKCRDNIPIRRVFERTCVYQPVVSKVIEVATKSSKSTAPASAPAALLTEEEIVKMGEKDYMNDAQLAFFQFLVVRITTTL